MATPRTWRVPLLPGSRYWRNAENLPRTSASGVPGSGSTPEPDEPIRFIRFLRTSSWRKIPAFGREFFALEPPARGVLAHLHNRAAPYHAGGSKASNSPTRPIRPGLRPFPISPTRIHVVLLQEDRQGRMRLGRRHHPGVPPIGEVRKNRMSPFQVTHHARIPRRRRAPCNAGVGMASPLQCLSTLPRWLGAAGV